MSIDRLSPERKATAGVAHVFAWRPADGFPSSAPTLTVRWPSGAASYVMAPVRSADVVASYDHSLARISIAVGGAIAGAIRGLLTEHGGAVWVDGGPAYQGPARVVGLVWDGSASLGILQLAEPLQGAPTVVGSWSLRWLTYAATLPAGDVGSARLRSVLWTLPWTRSTGTDAPTLERLDRGVIHVCAAPFSTGLSDDDLYAYVPGWSRLVPDRQATWHEQRAAAERDLIARLRPALPAGRYEDDVLGEQFREPHALFTAALIRRGHAALGYEGAAESADGFTALAEDALKRALGLVTWIDANNDGLVDANETDQTTATLSSGMLSNVTDAGYDTAAADARLSYWWSDR